MRRYLSLPVRQASSTEAKPTAQAVLGDGAGTMKWSRYSTRPPCPAAAHLEAAEGLAADDGARDAAVDVEVAADELGLGRSMWAGLRE